MQLTYTPTKKQLDQISATTKTLSDLILKYTNTISSNCNKNKTKYTLSFSTYNFDLNMCCNNVKIDFNITLTEKRNILIQIFQNNVILLETINFKQSKNNITKILDKCTNYTNTKYDIVNLMHEYHAGILEFIDIKTPNNKIIYTYKLRDTNHILTIIESPPNTYELYFMDKIYKFTDITQLRNFLNFSL